jgi:predicted nucleic acid-binding protein
MYLALAVRLNTRVITADERLVRLVASTPVAPYIQRVQAFGD